MEQSLSDRIRQRAYEIWAEHGYRKDEGEAQQNWLAAEQEILATLRPSPVAASVRQSKTTRSSKRSKALVR